MGCQDTSGRIILAYQNENILHTLWMMCRPEIREKLRRQVCDNGIVSCSGHLLLKNNNSYAYYKWIYLLLPLTYCLYRCCWSEFKVPALLYLYSQEHPTNQDWPFDTSSSFPFLASAQTWIPSPPYLLLSLGLMLTWQEQENTQMSWMLFLPLRHPPSPNPCLAVLFSGRLLQKVCSKSKPH